ncbi:MAG: hypothetical protein ACRERE_01490 [Candidatus Entotheonellia bacterium]
MRSKTRLIAALLLGLAPMLLPEEPAFTVRGSMHALAASAFAQTVLRVEGMFCAG